jgi:hypothetical protein
MANGNEVQQPNDIYNWATEIDTGDNTIYDPPTETHEKQGYRKEYPVFREWNFIFKNISDWLKYIRYFFDEKINSEIESLQEAAFPIEILGHNIEMDNENFIIRDLGKIALKKFGTNWYDENNVIIDTSSFISESTVNSVINTQNWDLYTGTGDGRVAVGTDAFVAGVSLYMFLFYNVDKNVMRVVCDSDVNGSNANTQFRAIEELEVGQDVYFRRIGANVTYEDGDIKLVQYFQNGDIFQTLGLAKNLLTGFAPPFVQSNTHNINLDSLGLFPKAMDRVNVSLFLYEDTLTSRDFGFSLEGYKTSSRTTKVWNDSKYAILGVNPSPLDPHSFVTDMTTPFLTITNIQNAEIQSLLALPVYWIDKRLD